MKKNKTSAVRVVQKRPRSASSHEATPASPLPAVVQSAAQSTVPSVAPKESTDAEPTPGVVQLTEEEYLKKISGKKSRREQQTSSSAAAGTVNMKLLATDPIYRILHHSHRSDVVEVVKCKFGEGECERAAMYLKDEFTAGPVRRLRLQLNVTGSELYMGRFFPFMAGHVATLRLLDLSRNQLNADDVVMLTRTLQLNGTTTRQNHALEVLDLSCNRDIGSRGATVLMKALSTSVTIRAVILKHISLDDEGAQMVAPYLASRPLPVPAPSSSLQSGGESADKALFNGFQWTGSDQHRAHCNFFLNLNENCLGPDSIRLLGKCLPEHVSLTVLHQRPKRLPRPVVVVPSPRPLPRVADDAEAPTDTGADLTVHEGV